jgi:hypothetical protein
MRYLAVLPILFLAWLITTNQISEVTDMNGKYAVTYKSYCTTVAPVYKTNGDLIVRDGNIDINLRMSSYVVQEVTTCP